MSNRISLITLGNKWILELDSAPNIGVGFTAPIGSEAFVNASGVGSQWYKFSSGDNDWKNVTDTVASYNVANYSSTQTLSINNDLVKCNPSGGSFVISLPQASSVAGKIFTIKKIDIGVNVVTITPYSSELIDLSSSYILELESEFVQIASDGVSGWSVISE